MRECVCERARILLFAVLVVCVRLLFTVFMVCEDPFVRCVNCVCKPFVRSIHCVCRYDRMQTKNHPKKP